MQSFGTIAELLKNAKKSVGTRNKYFIKRYYRFKKLFENN